MRTNILFCESENLCTYSSRSAASKKTQYVEIDPKLTLSNNSLILKPIKTRTHPSISQIDQSLDLEGISHEMPKMPR